MLGLDVVVLDYVALCKCSFLKLLKRNQISIGVFAGLLQVHAVQSEELLHQVQLVLLAQFRLRFHAHSRHQRKPCVFLGRTVSLVLFAGNHSLGVFARGLGWRALFLKLFVELLDVL